MTTQIINDLSVHTISKIQVVLKDAFGLIETREEAIEITHYVMVNMLHTILALSGWEQKSEVEIKKAVVHYLEQAALTYFKGIKIKSTDCQFRRE